MNDIFENIFLQIRSEMEQLSIVERVVGIKEAAEILEIPERTLRSRMNNGEFSEEKGEITRLASSIVFDKEAIKNRKFMKKEIYWQLKEKYEKRDVERKIIISYSEIDNKLDEILDEIRKK